MDPNIITIDSDDSNDSNIKNNQSSFVIVHRVINTNNSNKQNNSNNNPKNYMVKHCSVDEQPLQNNKHFNLNISKKDHHEIISHKNENKQKSKSNILDSEIIDLENYTSEQCFKPSNRNTLSKGRTLYGEEILNINSYNINRNNLTLKNQSFNNKEVINLCSDKEPIRPQATLVSNRVTNNCRGQFSNNNEKLQLQTSEKQNMNQQTNYDHPMAWSHNTTNFMKHSVNSVNPMNTMNSMMQNTNKVVVLQNPPTAHQNSMSRHHLPNNQNMYKTTEIRNVQSVYHPSTTYSCMNSPNYFQPGYYNNGIMMNSYVPNNNFWMRVKVEEIHNGGEVVAQYFYNNETQTPVSIENHFQVNAIASDANPQFIDISALPNITAHNANDNNLQLDTNKCNGTDEEKNNSNCPTPLLKKQLTQTMDTSGNSAVGEDVIFVGEFKQNSNTDNTNTNKSADSGDSSKTDNSTVKNMKNDETKQTRKRLRKNYEAVEPRRNPKRQVQANKEFTKIIDDIMWSDIEKENKMKKIAPKASKERGDKKPVRFSPRGHTTCGAVYSPPSPLSVDHIRKWPTEGMHEKPEYNPQTGEIEPFDYVTRNIAESYKSKINKPETKSNSSSKNKNEKNDSLNVLSHEMLHHMISYAATVIQMNNSSSATNEENKVSFLNDLGLTENGDALSEKNCDNIKQTFKNIIHSKDTDKNNDKYNLKDLLKNTMLMYCITNDVSQSDLVKYIDSLKPQDIINISNEQLGITDKNNS